MRFPQNLVRFYRTQGISYRTCRVSYTTWRVHYIVWVSFLKSVFSAQLGHGLPQSLDVFPTEPGAFPAPLVAFLQS